MTNEEIFHNLHHLSRSITDDHKNFVLEEVNNHCVRMAVMNEKVFPWHFHPNSDELFLILEGKLIIEFEDNEKIVLGPGELHKVPAGKIHRTIAKGRTVNLCFESKAAEAVFLNAKPLS